MNDRSIEGRLTSEHGIGVEVTKEAVLRSVTAKASNVDVVKYISSGLTDVFGLVWGVGSSDI